MKGDSTTPLDLATTLGDCVCARDFTRESQTLMPAAGESVVVATALHRHRRLAHHAPSSMSLHRLLLHHCHFPSGPLSLSLPRFRGPGSRHHQDCPPLRLSSLFHTAGPHWLGRISVRTARTHSFGLQVCHGTIEGYSGIPLLSYNSHA